MLLDHGLSVSRLQCFPDRILLGLRVARIGSTSVRYEFALFRNHDDLAAAQGDFVHVYVDRATRRPVELPALMRQSLAPFVNQSN
jgi:acyl-CoA thioester hydrolase